MVVPFARAFLACALRPALVRAVPVFAVLLMVGARCRKPFRCTRAWAGCREPCRWGRPCGR